VKNEKNHSEESKGLRLKSGEPGPSGSIPGEAEERFSEIEARYKALFDGSSYCVYIHDLKGRLLDANDAALRLFGYERNEIKSLTFTSLLDEDQLSDAHEAVEEIKKLGSAKKPKEYRLKTKDGGRVWVETDAAVLYRQGKPYAVQGVARDITARKQAEAALRESERKYRTLFDDSRDAIYITTREGIFLAANPALLKLFGYTENHLMEQFNVRDLYADPHDREKFQRKVEKYGSVKNHDVQFRKKNGEEMQCLLTASVRRATTGDILGYQGIIRDITEQKKAEEILRESEAHYRAVVEAFDGLIYICSPDFRVEFMNRRFIERTGYNAIGELCYKALHNLDAICPWCVNTRVFKGETVRWEVQSPKDQRWWYVVNTPIYHEDGSMSKQSMILDITDRKKMEEELKESSKRIKLFAYSVSHDLKNPAVSAYAFAKRLRERYGDVLDEKGGNYCDRIMRASEQIAALVEQIGVFIKAKEVPLNLEDVNLKEMLQICREEFSTQLEARQIKWREPRNIPRVKADRISISRVLRNLVDNALKYGGDDLSEIIIGYTEKDDRHVLSVADNGIGIKAGDAKRVFGMFIRKNSARGIQGTGLGLAIVKEIAERHGGGVWATPRDKKGITFYVSLSKDIT